MLDRLLPRQADNIFRGRRLALWIFGLILLLLAVMSVNSIFIGRFVAMNADGLPLDTFKPAAERAIISSYAVWGVTQLIIVMVCVITLIRYRSLVPLMFLLLLLQQLFWRLVHYYMSGGKPERLPASWFIILLFSLMVLGSILSLWSRRAEA